MNPKFIPYTIILLLLYVIFFLQECQPKHKCPAVKSDTVKFTQINEVPVARIFRVPVPYAVVDSFWHNVDTAFILAHCITTYKDFSALNIYNRQLFDDSLGTMHIIDSIQYNKLKGYALAGHLNATTHTQYITQSVSPKLRLQVFAGIQFGSDLQNFSVIPSVYLVTAKSHFYSLGYNPFQKTGYAGLAWKIHF